MKKLLPLIFLFLPFISFGQTPFKWDFGGGLGITSYQGDLDALKVNTGFREIHFSVAAYLRRNLSNNFATRIGLVAGKLAGDDANFAEPEWRVLRGIYFESPFAEVTAIAEYYPLGMYPKRGKSIKARRAVAPYLFIGVGGAYSNPTVFWNDTNGNEYIDPEAAQRDKEAKTNKVNIVTPLGLGLRFLLKDHSTFGLEAALRPTYSDYLDGVSQAGNPNENDWYFTAQIGFSYPFGKNKRNKPIAKTEELKEKTKEKPRQKDLFVDTDKDGIADFDDDCPITPGLKSLKGCPDKDGDGVADKYDLCSEQPGPVELNGCPDSDDDGIADKDDKCPDVPGQAAYRGCMPSDQDEDGIADKDDLCPDAAGPVELNGCPDSDGDGIADKDDKCPDVAGIADQKGCPALPPPDKAIYFRAAQDNWYRTSDETLDEVVGILKNDNSLKAVISGHTDDAAETATANLSGNRAKKVYDFLVSQGIPPSRLQFTGKGSSQPVSEKLLSDDPLLNQQLRRRVEVRFTRE
ncbi:MAG: OmpA family protein [Haliscomenobacteraceae bacterium CHB4]|nr:OmpA family protein [Haliscomenobacteraceae bacterium CHB4]